MLQLNIIPLFWRLHKMNKNKLQREGQKWVHDGIITEQQLNAILDNYVKRNPSYIFITFAVLFISIGVLLFIFSDWTLISNRIRVAIITVFMFSLYILGDYLYKSRTNAYGISFIILGYVFFGATLFLITNLYQVSLINVWMFFIWSILGLLLFFIYKNPYLFAVGLLITIIGQIYSTLAFSSFHFLLFAVFIFGYFHFVFHERNPLSSYLFVIGFSIQMPFLVVVEDFQYYWLIILFFLPYVMAQFLKENSLKSSFTYISFLSIFIFKMYESFLLQESYFVNEIKYNFLFFILWGLIWISILSIKWLKNNKLELIDLILFIPLFFLPNAYIFVLLSMFIFAIYWLFIGYQQELHDKIIVGITSFILSTFTAYIQFAWETMNRSLFFVIGGILLFLISYFFERKRRLLEGSKSK